MLKAKQQQKLPLSTQSGFTIIESLLAIIMVGILMTAIAPAIVLSVATRVQAKRVELGTNAAKSYIDGVRSGAILPPPITNTALGSLAAPSAGDLSTPCAINSNCTTSTTFALYCIDNDRTPGCNTDSMRDMIVQGYGYQSNNYVAGLTNGERAAKGYQLGVRVYRADAFQGSDSLKKSDSSTRTRARTFTGGSGDRRAPLVEMTSEIVTGETKYTDLCARINTSGRCN